MDDIHNMVNKICEGRWCDKCPIWNHCLKPWTENDIQIIIEAYDKLFGVEIKINSDELISILEE